jgi:tetratricopeptide (TPR) repeat protein
MTSTLRAGSSTATTSCAIRQSQATDQTQRQEDQQNKLFHKHPFAFYVLERRFEDARRLVPNLDLTCGINRHWLGVLELNTDNLKAASKYLHGTDVKASLGVLAALQRLLGEPRGYLTALPRDFFDHLEPFDRAQTERELGLWHFEREEWATALNWLERAWQTAKTGELAQYQLGAIGHDYAQMLERSGFDHKAIGVLEEAIPFADPTRAMRMLFRLGLCHAHLGNTVDVHVAISRFLQSDIPKNESEFVVLLNYLYGLVQNLNYSQLIGYQCFAHARFAAKKIGSDFVFFANLQMYAIREGYEPSAPLNPYTEREQAWAAWVRGKVAMQKAELQVAHSYLTEAVSRFAYQQLHREQAFAHLALAEVYALDGKTQARDRELERANHCAKIIGSNQALKVEARAFPNIASLLEQISVKSRQIVVYEDCITVDGVPIRHRHKQAVQLFKHCHANPETTMETMLEALGLFDSNWIHQLKWWLCREVNGFTLEYDRKTKLYTTQIEADVHFATAK